MISTASARISRDVRARSTGGRAVSSLGIVSLIRELQQTPGWRPLAARCPTLCQGTNCGPLPWQRFRNTMRIRGGFHFEIRVSRPHFKLKCGDCGMAGVRELLRTAHQRSLASEVGDAASAARATFSSECARQTGSVNATVAPKYPGSSIQIGSCRLSRRRANR